MAFSLCCTSSRPRWGETDRPLSLSMYACNLLQNLCSKTNQEKLNIWKCRNKWSKLFSLIRIFLFKVWSCGSAPNVVLCIHNISQMETLKFRSSPRFDSRSSGFRKHKENSYDSGEHCAKYWELLHDSSFYLQSSMIPRFQLEIFYGSFFSYHWFLAVFDSGLV